MQRAAVSITSNIAEGFGRSSYKEKRQFYNQAKGSLIELQNQLLIAKDVGYLDNQIFNKIAEQSVSAAKLLNIFLKTTKDRIYESMNLGI